MRLGHMLALCTCVALGSCAPRPQVVAASSPCDEPARQVMTIPDIRYSQARSQRLDLYLPWRKAGEPLVVFAHGGGWSGGDRRSYGFVARHFAVCGIAFASVDYPLAPRVRADAQARAMLDAALWLAHRAAIYGYNGDRMVLMGHSAGAQIVSLAALSPRLRPQRQGLGIAGVVAISGLGFAPPQAGVVATLPAYLRTYYATAFGPQVRQWRLFDVTRDLRRGAPPFAIVRGADDSLSPESQSASLAQALRLSGNSVTYLQPAGRDHNSVIADIAAVPDDPTGIEIERFVFGATE